MTTVDTVPPADAPRVDGPHSNVRYYDGLADVWDSWTGGDPDTDAAVAFLAGRCPGGRALELGVGTGRVAVPLSESGVEVTGVEGSPAMLRRLAGRPGATAVRAVAGDLVRPSVAGPFDVVYAVCSTLHDLLTQNAQRDCLRAVAALLRPGGELVVEALVPDAYESEGGLVAGAVRREQVGIQAATTDRATQRVRTQVVGLSPSAVTLHPLQLRYVWPGELDLMAALAGLSPVLRHGGWGGEPFGRDSSRHVSVYRAG